MLELPRCSGLSPQETTRKPGALLMEISHMLHQMCHTGLSQADINAIAKTRGFRKEEVANRAALESFFLSTIGVEKALAELTEAETACLQLLSRQTGGVPIPFFERIYSSARADQRYFYGTFSQEFKPVYDQVRKNLVRRGVLITAELDNRAGLTKMERQRYWFPDEFVGLLPPLIRQPHAFAVPGVNRAAQVLRDKLQEIVLPPAKVRTPRAYSWEVRDGTLVFNGQFFRAAQLSAWQFAAWESSLTEATQDGPGAFSPAGAVQAILASLPPGKWAAPAQMEPLLPVYCRRLKIPSAAKICEAGWKYGKLARHLADSKAYYRAVPPFSPETEELPGDPNSGTQPSEYLTARPEGALVDLARIPFTALEELNRLARFEIIDRTLKARPDRVKLGRAPAHLREAPLADWLSAHIPKFQEAFSHVRAHWGEILIHTHLLTARVKDLSLRVQLERALGENLQLLSDEYLAFPAAYLSDVEKILKKGGYVIKKVRP